VDQLRATLIAIVVASMIASGIAFLTRQKLQNTDDVRYAAQAGAMVLAAREFAAVNRSNILSAAANAAWSYTVTDMINLFVLDPSVSATTPTGGTWCLEFRTYNSGANLQGILTVVNEASPKTYVDAQIVAQSAGQAFAGVIDLAAANAVYPGGSQALSLFTGAHACSPAANAFAAVITDNDSIGTTNYLARVPISGNASANRMTTDLDLGGNNINNANGVNAATMVATTSVSAQVYYHTSDRSLKNRIAPIADPWRLLAPIRGKSWRWNSDGRPDLGVIAQDVEISLPELVTRNAIGDKQVNYDGLIAPLIEEVRQLHHQVAEDRRRIAALKETLMVARRPAGEAP
jgi:hypothetical protein